MPDAEGRSAKGRDGVAGPVAAAGERRPHLDGVRAVAVYLVVAFHAGVGQLGGGFIGVDVFFVLSGYLVTGLLVGELAPAGRVGLGRFYARRARRLLPAAALTLLTTAVVYPLVVTPLEAAASRETLWSAAAGVANWAFLARSTDYFASDVTGDPVLHFWSLAVEEQFYLVWPVALMGLWWLCRRTRRPRAVLGTVLAAGTAAGAAWAAHLAVAAPERAHFATDARAYQLLAGAVLALVGPAALARLGARGRWPGPVAAGALLAVVALASPRIDIGPTTRGLVATVVTVALVASLDAGPGVARRLLAQPLVTLLGRVSYGTYLWHWIVVIVLARQVSLGPPARAVVTAVVATGLAILSARLVEMPVRSSVRLDRRPRRVLAVAVTGQVLLAALVLPGLNRGVTATQEVEVAASADDGGAGEVDWRAAAGDRVDVPYCRATAVAECTLVRGTGPHVVLLGDSHAEMLAPAFVAAAAEADLTVSVVVRSTCPWTRGVGFLITGLQECFERQDEWYEETLPALAPDIVVATHRATDDLTSPVTLVYRDNATTEAGDPELPGRLAPLAAASLDALVAMGARVLVLEPTPVAARETVDPLACLSQATTVEQCSFGVPTGPTPLEQVQRDAVRDRTGDGVSIADIDGLVCPRFPTCDAVVDGDVVFRDDTHLTASRARALADDFLALLRDQGWLE